MSRQRGIFDKPSNVLFEVLIQPLSIRYGAQRCPLDPVRGTIPTAAKKCPCCVRMWPFRAGVWWFSRGQ